ncbi:alpha/beta hydrolase [Gordonia polyisoprenivorans]|uniref:alpha/beta hydrolase n=1 Tax=Gordonia polyisoprenivorans TaxID=84595 RepID=UPI0002E9B65C|nr:alpha/beta hydrolase family protein [Gordonia polyisoprenivorans]
MRWKRVVPILVVTLIAVVTTAAWSVGPASAAPGRIVSSEAIGSHQLLLSVFSPSMDRSIPVRVLRAADRRPVPRLYLLNGAGGGEDSANWVEQGNAPAFFADKPVDVIIPMAGAFSYYTDWQRDDPTLGRNRWETFLTRELPAALDGILSSTGRNGIAGLSMSGSAALSLAERAGDLYSAVASMSGCPNTSGLLGSAYVRATVEGRGAADTTNMWGPPGSPDWVAHDAQINAERLRGKAVFVSSGPGVPGQHDNLSDAQHIQMILVGGPIEAAVDECSHRFVARLAALGIGVTTYFPPTGTHSFAYWNDALARAWPVLASGLR